VDFYELLGVRPDAGPEEIKRAYRWEAKRCHSDLTRGSDELMQALNEAYATLADPQRRRSYDWSRRSRGRPAPHAHEERARPPEPYLSPSQINWATEGTASAEPVSVRLSNRGGPVTTIEPDRLGGAFWAIEETVGVMSGEHLADVVIAPLGVDALPPGTYVDEVSFLFDGRPARVGIVAVVAASATPSPPSPSEGGGSPEPPATPRPPAFARDRLGVMGVIAALVSALLLAIAAAILGTAAGEPSHAQSTLLSAGPGPARAPGLQGPGLIRQGRDQVAQWEVLGVDVEGSPDSFTVDFGGSQRAAAESSCVYVRGTKVFPLRVRGSRYLQTSREFRSEVKRHGGRAGLEHRHSYTITFPYFGAGRYSFVYGCSSQFVPAIDLFTRRRTSRSPGAAVLRGPLHPDGVLLVARNAGAGGDQVKLGPIDVLGGDLLVRYERAGASERFDARGRSCLRRGARVIAAPLGPNEDSLLLAPRDNTAIPSARAVYQFQFMCGRYEPALPISGSLFNQ
jgi:hypothetical protein